MAKEKKFEFVDLDKECPDVRSAEWKNMPEFVQDDLTPWKSIYVHFVSKEDMAAFALLVEQGVTPNTRQIWYPKATIGHFINKRYKSES